MQVVLAAVLADALHAAFEDGEEAFDRVGMSVAANVFILGVFHRLMAGERCAKRAIPPGFIGHHVGVAGDVLARDGQNGFAVHLVHNEADLFATA